MSTPAERRARVLGFRDGSRAAITWLHKLAGEMNDPHARQILNSAAFSLGAHYSDAAVAIADPPSSPSEKQT